ncbi:hypothetical protein P5X88_02910 [Heyndrickxia oleronia]|uniref:Uncharacterized protein n=1 Tax=Heyndrickxia oleronia TaxID=38875 RepID=A0AAW6SSC4_9BACI|nr:hypothetical protein [Heyndrickxia oleronia]
MQKCCIEQLKLLKEMVVLKKLIVGVLALTLIVGAYVLVDKQKTVADATTNDNPTIMNSPGGGGGTGGNALG